MQVYQNNLREPNSVWWQTTLHILLFAPAAYLALIAVNADNMLSGASTIQYPMLLVFTILSTLGGLFLPTLFIKKSNKKLVVIAIGAFHTILLLMTLTSCLTDGFWTPSLYSDYSNFGDALQTLIALISIIGFYFRDQIEQFILKREASSSRSRNAHHLHHKSHAKPTRWTSNR